MVAVSAFRGAIAASYRPEQEQMIEACEREIRGALEQFHPANSPQALATELTPASSPTKPGSGRRSGDIVLRTELKQAIGMAEEGCEPGCASSAKRPPAFAFFLVPS